MANNNSELIKSIAADASQMYSEDIFYRSLIQMVPILGGPLDTVLSGYSSKISQKRMVAFVEELSKRLESVEIRTEKLNDEAFVDLMTSTFEAVTRSRSQAKRASFAAIIAKQVSSPAEWEEPESAVRLLASLDELHIQVLVTALEADKVLEGGFSGKSIISLNTGEKVIGVSLPEKFSNYGIASLRMVCAELMSKGLLHDEAVGKLSGGAMVYFSATDLADWFIGWLKYN